MKRRYFELDLTRSFVVLLLPFLHVFEDAELWGFATVELLQAYSWIVKFCISVPSVFMVVMGMNLVFSGRTDAKNILKRGIYLLVASYILNIFRFLVPAVVAYLFSGTPDWMGIDLAIICCIAPDIMTFAGFAFLTLAFLTYLKFSKTKMLVVALVLMVINDLLANVEYHCPEIVQVALGSFVWTNGYSFFPLFSWFIYPVYGYFIADYVINTAPENLRRFWRKVALISASVLLVMLGIISYFGLEFWKVAVPPLNDYITSSMTNVIDVCATNMVIYFGYEFYHWLKLQRFNNYIQHFSVNLNAFYMIHWLIVGSWQFYRLGAGRANIVDVGITFFWVTSVTTCVVSIILAPYFRKYILLPAEKYVVG